MQRFPQWSATVDPTGGGPLVVRSNVGRTGLALSQVGRSIAGIGQYLTAEGKAAAERAKAADEISQASTNIREISEQMRSRVSAIRTNADPNRYEPLYNEMREEALARLDGIEDPEVRVRVQTKIDSELDFHYRDILTLRDQRRAERTGEEIEQSAEQAVRAGDVELYEDLMANLVDTGFLTESQAGASLRQVRSQALIWQTAVALGWREAQKYLADPQTWKDVPLSTEEMAKFKTLIESNLRSQEAVEAREAMIEEQRLRQVGDDLLTRAQRGELSDPMEIDQALAEGAIDRAEMKQLYELMRKGPVSENDVETMIAARRMIDGIERGTVTSEQTVAFLRANVSRLKPDTFATLTKEATDVWSFQARAVGNVRRFAVTQLVSGDDDLLDRLRMLGAGKDVLTPLEERRKQEYRLVEYVETQLRDWMAQNPQATYEEAATRGRQWIDQVQQLDQMQRRNLLDAWRTTEPAQTAPLRPDAPPDVQRLVTDALDAGIPLSEILSDPEVAPYVER